MREQLHIYYVVLYHIKYSFYKLQRSESTGRGNKGARQRVCGRGFGLEWDRNANKLNHNETIDRQR